MITSLGKKQLLNFIVGQFATFFFSHLHYFSQFTNYTVSLLGHFDTLQFAPLQNKGNNAETMYNYPRLRKNNNKKAYQLVKDLTTEKQGKTTTIQDKPGKCLTEENEILNTWTEYCSDLYNYKTVGDPIVLDCPQIPDAEHHPILREKVEAAVKVLKMGKSDCVVNIPAELVQATS